MEYMNLAYLEDVWNCFINFTMKQLYKKIELLEHLFRRSYNSTFFFLEQSLWSCICLTKICRVELEKIERRSSLKQALALVILSLIATISTRTDLSRFHAWWTPEHLYYLGAAISIML